jgi:hypothetical protein
MRSGTGLWVGLSLLASLGCDVREQRADAGQHSQADAALPADDAGASTIAAADGGRTDAAAPQPPAGPVPTRFVVENTGDAPVLLGASDCYARWLSLHQDQRMLRWDDACLCQCGSGMGCVCPTLCPRAQELLMPTMRAEIEWDGVVRAVQPSECFEPEVPELGTALSAKACWGGLLGSGVAPTCSSTDFKYGEDQVVQLEAAGSPAEAHKVSFELTNGTGEPIEIVKERCAQQGMFKLDMGDRTSTTYFCPCTCSADKQQATCATCGACTPDVVETIAPNEHVTVEWDGLFVFTYPSRCIERHAYPPGLSLRGKLCWRKVGETAERCTSVGWVHGVADSVSATAQ